MSKCDHQFEMNFDEDMPCLKCGVKESKTWNLFDRIELWYYKTVPFGLRPKNVWYKFKCWAWNRYTTIKPRKLDHGWCDRRELVYHAVFEVCCDFIDKEGPKTQEEWDWQEKHNPDFYKAWAKAKEIRDWWTNEYDEDYPWSCTDQGFDEKVSWEVPKDYEGTRNDYRPVAKLNEEQRYEQTVREKAKEVIEISMWFWT